MLSYIPKYLSPKPHSLALSVGLVVGCTATGGGFVVPGGGAGFGGRVVKK